MAQRITNNDIWERLGRIEEIIIVTRDQAMKTNGRVTKLEYWQAGLLAIADEKKDIKPPNDSVDYTKIILYALGLVGTALSIITVMANK